MTEAEMLQQGKFDELAELLVTSYLGNNRRLFERDEVNRRMRTLSTYVQDAYQDRCATHGAGPEDVEAVLKGSRDFLTKLIPEEEMPVEAIPSEDEDEVAVPVFRIRVYPSDPTLEVLRGRWEAKEIITAEFQRGWVWKPQQASKLVESFLAGLPVPPVFFYRETSGKELIIDGQQRLRTIAGFFEKKLPDSSPFFLRGVSSQWEGRNFDTLNESDRKRFRNSILRVIVVEQIEPDDTSSMYEVFSRLNTGGTALSPQEVRNASCHGPFNDMLKDLNKVQAWRRVFGIVSPDVRMRDVELIARFLALLDGNYQKPMKKFITDFMYHHRGGAEREKYAELFKRTVQTVYEKLGAKPFHISRGINAAVFDSVMIAFARHAEMPADIRARYNNLISMKSYLETVSSSTTDVDTVRQRIDLAGRVLFS